MKKFKLITLLLLMVTTTFAIAKDDEDIDFLYSYLQGEYILIGKAPDSNSTYHGTVKLNKIKNRLQFIRVISNKEIKGEAKIEYATDRVKVLRVNFIEDNEKYEATYLINSDLDNYGRLSGFLYEKSGKTKVPGFEALFSTHILK